MSAENIRKIKIKLKKDYNFIKNDGNILTNIAKDLLTENDNDYQKTLEFIETLSKKNIQDRMWEIKQELETAGEISNLIKETIKKDKTESDNLKFEIDGVINKIFELEETVSELEESVSKLENNKEQLEKSFETKQIELVTSFDTQTNKLKTDVDVLITTKDSLHSELTEIKDSINGVFRKGIYKDEFEYEECEYIIKEPIIHLDIVKYCPLIISTRVKRANEFNVSSYMDDYSELNSNKEDIKINFPVNIKLMDNEYIIKTYLINIVDNNNKNFRFNDRWGYYIIYITNYGRLLKTDIVIFGVDCIEGGMLVNNRLNKILLSSVNNLDYTYTQSIKTHCINGVANIYEMAYGIKTKELPINIAQKLTFRMPRIFLDVIDAFHTQNNDLMQDCCKKYLDITRECQYKTDLILSIEQNSIIQKQTEELNKKDKEIEERDIIIKNLQEELEKIKLENAKLKTALSVLTS